LSFNFSPSPSPFFFSASFGAAGFSRLSGRPAELVFLTGFLAGLDVVFFFRRSSSLDDDSLELDELDEPELLLREVRKLLFFPPSLTLLRNKLERLSRLHPFSG
jgi:hypothetical protein